MTNIAIIFSIPFFALVVFFISRYYFGPPEVKIKRRIKKYLTENIKMLRVYIPIDKNQWENFLDEQKAGGRDISKYGPAIVKPLAGSQVFFLNFALYTLKAFKPVTDISFDGQDVVCKIHFKRIDNSLVRGLCQMLLEKHKEYLPSGYRFNPMIRGEDEVAIQYSFEVGDEVSPSYLLLEPRSSIRLSDYSPQIVKVM